jgi:hypothetical protein
MPPGEELLLGRQSKLRRCEVIRNLVDEMDRELRRQIFPEKERD